MPLQDARRAELLADLDRGEAEVIALAQELYADLVIIDERLARRHAKRLGLKVTGTLGVLLRAKTLGLVPAVRPLIEQLRQSGIRLGDSLVAEALELAEETWKILPRLDRAAKRDVRVKTSEIPKTSEVLFKSHITLSGD